MKKVSNISYKSKPLVSIIGLVLLVSVLSCTKVGEFYAGLHLQPEISKDDFVPGLNVFGILKTGPSFDTLNHFFEVQQLEYIFSAYDTTYIEDATIELFNSKRNQSYQLFYSDEGEYLNENMIFNAGEVWEYECLLDTFFVTSTTSIPNEPIIVKSTLLKENTNIEFEIAHDTSAFLYDVYLIMPNSFEYKRVVANSIGNTYVALVAEKQIEQAMLFVYAYDENFEKYYTTSNIFFKPNAFRLPFTQVAGGYGVFGSVSGAMIEIE